METHGSHGPSGFDAIKWAKYYFFLETHQTNDFSKAIAKIALRMATETITPEQLQAYNVCRLLTFDKNPGVHAIGKGEVLRRVIGRTITKCISQDLLDLSSNKQLCLGKKAELNSPFNYSAKSLKRSIVKHSFYWRQIFLWTRRALNRRWVNAKISVWPVSRKTLLMDKNICPVLQSVETGVKGRHNTRRASRAMATYQIAVLPLFEKVRTKRLMQRWHAGDGPVAGKLEELPHVLENLIKPRK